MIIWGGSLDPEDLLNKWEQGVRMDPRPYYGWDFSGFKTKDPTQEIQIHYINVKDTQKAA